VRVEHDPDVLLRLILGETRACLERPRHRLVEVIYAYVEVHRRVLTAGLARPDRPLVLLVRLDVDAE